MGRKGPPKKLPAFFKTFVKTKKKKPGLKKKTGGEKKKNKKKPFHHFRGRKTINRPLWIFFPLKFFLVLQRGQKYYFFPPQKIFKTGTPPKKFGQQNFFLGDFGLPKIKKIFFFHLDLKTPIFSFQRFFFYQKKPKI